MPKKKKKKKKNYILFPNVQKEHGNKSYKSAIFQRFALGLLVEGFQKQLRISAIITLFHYFFHNFFSIYFSICLLHYCQGKLSSNLILKA